MPDRVLYVEPLRRKMSVGLGGGIIARSDGAVILFEPARYPVAYFPIGDVDETVLQPSDHTSTHADLGETKWFDVVGGDGKTTQRGAWQHVDPPGQAAALRDTVAFAWRTMDAFYEEDERILGHAADPYHRIDIRRTSRHLVVRQDDRLIADTQAPPRRSRTRFGISVAGRATPGDFSVAEGCRSHRPSGIEARVAVTCPVCIRAATRTWRVWRLPRAPRGWRGADRDRASRRRALLECWSRRRGG